MGITDSRLREKIKSLPFIEESKEKSPKVRNPRARKRNNFGERENCCWWW